jgi:SAM-dependent methyltransferase
VIAVDGGHLRLSRMHPPERAREDEVAAIFDRLRREVTSSPPTALTAEGPVDPWGSARDEAERAWPVTAERPYTGRPGALGRIRSLILVPLKGVLRRLMRWYVEPLAFDQKAFNAAALRLLDNLDDRLIRSDERLDERTRETAEAVRIVPELEDRVKRLERARRGATVGPAERAPAPGGTPAPSAPIDYFAFEARMRGPTTDVSRRQKRYVEYFRDAGPVLDLGCGRGEFLGLLRSAGIDARGVDLDPDMVAFGTEEGLEVEEGEAVTHLEKLADASLGGIFAAQVVEHLPPAAIIRLLELAVAKLAPRGVLVLETVNPLSFFSLRHYFADLSHVQPLVPDTLELLAQQAGFREVEIRFMNEPPAEDRLRSVDLPAGILPEASREALEHNVARLNEVVFGPQDYALVART